MPAKKNIEIFIGSPRETGNTSILVAELRTRIDQNKFNINLCFLYKNEILACEDCRVCKTGELECIVEDDMRDIYPKIEASDILIFGTPIYWFGPSAKMKLLIDRLRPYYQNKRLAQKKGVFILPAGSGEVDCDLTIEMFNRIFSALDIEYIGHLTAEAYDEGDVKKDISAIASIKELGEKINELI